MVTGSKNVFSCAANFIRGRKCIFCGSFKVNKTSRHYVKCRGCGKSKSLPKLKREIEILKGFYQQQPAYRLAHDLNIDIKVIARVYQQLREILYQCCELESSNLEGEIELDAAYLGGKCEEKGRKDASGKSIVFALLEYQGRIHVEVSEQVTAEELMEHIQQKTRTGSVYYTDNFRGYHSLKRYGKHHIINHQKSLVDKKTKNHINGIEGFWSYAKHILYNYRKISKYYFPMYLKEIEYRYNHRNENLFKQFIQLYFGFVSP